MEKHFIWVFFIVALFLGFMVGMVYTNSQITGFITQEGLSEASTAVTQPTSSETSSEAATEDAQAVEQTFFQRLFGIAKPATTTYVDSDDGAAIWLLGICTGANGQFSDACISNTLREFYLEGDNCLSMDYDCVALGYESCSNGACVGGETTTPLGGITPSEGTKLEIYGDLDTYKQEYKLTFDDLLEVMKNTQIFAADTGSTCTTKCRAKKGTCVMALAGSDSGTHLVSCNEIFETSEYSYIDCSCGGAIITEPRGGSNECANYCASHGLDFNDYTPGGVCVCCWINCRE